MLDTAPPRRPQIVDDMAVADVSTSSGAGGVVVLPDPYVTHISVRGTLESLTAEALLRVFDEALMRRPRRVELDLSGVTAATDAGAEAVATCLCVGRSLDDGVGVTVRSEAGRAVLLKSLAAV